MLLGTNRANRAAVTAVGVVVKGEEITVVGVAIGGVVGEGEEVEGVEGAEGHEGIFGRPNVR